jgi:ankyrin repeat protein
MEPPTFASLWDRAQEGNSDAIRSAIDYILPTYLDPNGIFAKLAKIAIINNHISVLKVLLTRKKYVRDTRVCAKFGRSGYTLLELASMCGYTESMQFILQSLNSVKNINTGMSVYLAIYYRHIESLQLLINAKADIEKQTFNDSLMTRPIHTAVYTNQLNIATLLIQSGVGINTRNQYGETSLMLTCSCDYPDMTELLLNAKANINKKSRMGKTPLDIALSRSPHCATLLINAKASV